MDKFESIIKELKRLGNPEAVKGMARFGINPENTLGVSIPNIRRIAKQAGRDHQLAKKLWASGIHEARLLAGFVDRPEEVTEKQMEEWVRDFNSWDVCDQVVSNLFDKTLPAYAKAVEWSAREEEFVKRAGFVMMAALAVHDKKVVDGKFKPFFKIMRRESGDERNFVKKAVNWALRQIGKRNSALNAMAIREADTIAKLGTKSARWIAADALRELKSGAVRKKLNKASFDKDV